MSGAGMLALDQKQPPSQASFGVLASGSEATTFLKLFLL